VSHCRNEEEEDAVTVVSWAPGVDAAPAEVEEVEDSDTEAADWARPAALVEEASEVVVLEEAEQAEEATGEETDTAEGLAGAEDSGREVGSVGEEAGGRTPWSR
jgi:hypothetical protein